MQLIKALRIEPGKVAAFVGAGGKTSAIRRLVQELSGPALVTTTTHIGRDQAGLAEVHRQVPAGLDFASAEGSALLESLRSGQPLLLTGPLNPAGDRWTAVELSPALVQVARAAGAPLLVETDGARRRAFKAPADHEPALSGAVEPDVVVPVAALDVLGQPIDSELVHRPERVAALLGLEQAAAIGPAELAAVLGSEAGGLKRTPATAEVRVLLTKATPERLAAARQIAGLLLQNDRIHSVAIADLVAGDPVLETHGRVAGVVLAAGGSSRLGRPKQLVEWRGRPLVWHAVRAALEGGLAPVVVVVGQSAEQVRRAIASEPVAIAENPAWEAGQSGSVRTGLVALDQLPPVEAALMLLADMPFVDAAVVEAVVERHRQTLAPLVAPFTGGRRSNPVLFDHATFADLLQLEGDRGGRALFDRYPHERLEWDEAITFDLDTAADLDRLRGLE